ncbi:N-acetyltransferase [Microbacterium sorbitolivorans]|uniref:GNAT family N-acetyltransferase n=1 Tax=Microbacterium sorbitolivorans TaxID=1867410 RepID=A0A367XZR9_9MICO|nr:GNAT family N-acetyltransferase [Microbacterium sorbitolivorans]RCK58302.1 GNAT family N-acetyltransferase [Microbacterium sorbitolivorans]GGF35361.1 N-acetyltransferase [Microbacterium sorbitolivorans]
MLEALNLPTSVFAHDTEVVIRRATRDDLHELMRLLSDDPISAGRGDRARDADQPAYEVALDRIIGDPSNEIIVVTDAGGAMVGTLQLTLIPGMARRGSTRLLVEAVRVASTERGSGIGSALMRWVMDEAATELGAALVQLTSDAAREDAHRFYTRLGFVDSHIGFKYYVKPGL